MKIRSFISTFAAIAASTAMAASSFGLQLDNTLPTNSGFSDLKWDEASSSWTMTATQNDFKNVRPAVRFTKLTQDVNAEYDVLSFEYRSERPVGEMKLTVYNAGSKGTSTRNFTYSITMPASENWTTFRLDVSNARKHALTKFGLTNQYFDISFLDMTAPSSFAIKAPRIEQDELAFKAVTVLPEKENLIEAEDFNISVKGVGHTARQTDRSMLTRYIDPYPGQFPIYAFTSVSFETVDNPDGMRGWETLMQKKYKDLWEAGFNMTEGCAFPGVDRAALFPDQTINTSEPIDLFEGTELKMILRAGLDNPSEREEVISKAKSSPRLAGYCVKDEPHCVHFDAMKSKLNAIRDLDNTHLLYGNLLHVDTRPGDIGATSYDDYVDRYINETNMGFLSYDFYAVRQLDNTETSTAENTILMPNFFENLEIISKFAKAYDTKFWAFTRAMSSVWHTGASSVSGTYNYKYPAPTEDHMRVQAFSALMYGAQGLQYWPYMSCDGCEDAPITRDGTKNPAWYYAKAINTDVKALTWVFLGAEMLRVGHTNAETPKGCLRLTKAMLPQGIESVTTNGQGMPVSVLQNGKNLFVMVLNPDLFANQTATVTVSKNMKRVLIDGTTENVTAGTYNHDLKPGRFVIYLVDENVPEHVTYASVPGIRSDYRNDADDVIITENPAASGAHYVSDMGHTSWSVYGGITPANENRSISINAAQAHWGSKFSYTFEVAEDMPVDIYVGHSVPWNEYGRVASIGAEPGNSYTIEGNPTLNWTKQYAASMRLYLDGEVLTPSNQTARPAVPAVFSEDGAEFNRILADKSQWIPTANPDGSASDVLYFWPKAGGDNSFAPVYNDQPDYQTVMLKAGKHRVTVESLAYPWHFDNLKIDTRTQTSGIDNVIDDNVNAPVEWYNLQGVRVNPETATPGLYLRRQGTKTQKVAL